MSDSFQAKTFIESVKRVYLLKVWRGQEGEVCLELCEQQPRMHRKRFENWAELVCWLEQDFLESYP